MRKQSKGHNGLSRRAFIGFTAGATVLSFLPRDLRGKEMPAQKEQPDSTFGGVKIGAITYSFRDLPGRNAEETLNYLLQCGLSHCELMAGALEDSAGAPKVTGGNWRQMQKQVSEWRKTVTSFDKFKEIREMYNQAGVSIHIVKFDNIGGADVPDEEHEYMFNVAKIMGARGITTELDENKAAKLAESARKHGIAIVFHNHTQLRPTTFSEGNYFASGPEIMSNLDIGHYAAGNGISSIVLVEELAAQNRLFSIHLKDRKFSGETVPFGEGDAQVAEILKLIQKNKWDINCDIELEYPIPENSDPIAETKKCVEFCKSVLA